MEASSKVFRFEEVAEHTKKNDCWLIISGKVYNVTEFLEEHPGGDDVLLGVSGKDATEDFDEVGHSDDAKETMNKFYVGKIDVSTLPHKKKAAAAATVVTPSPPPPRPATTATTTAQLNQFGSQSSSSSSSSVFLYRFLQLLVPLAVFGAAFYWNKLIN